LFGREVLLVVVEELGKRVSGEMTNLVISEIFLLGDFEMKIRGLKFNTARFE